MATANKKKRILLRGQMANALRNRASTWEDLEWKLVGFPGCDSTSNGDMRLWTQIEVGGYGKSLFVFINPADVASIIASSVAKSQAVDNSMTYSADYVSHIVDAILDQPVLTEALLSAISDRLNPKAETQKEAS